MAFRLPVHLENYEFRGLRTGSTDKGAWMSMVLENPEDSRQLDVSVPREMHGDVYNLSLKKGDVLVLDVIAYAGNEYNRVSLEKLPLVVDPDTGEVEY